MVGRWGMSRAIGPVAVLADERRGPVGLRDETSEQTRRTVDREVRQIVTEALDTVMALLGDHRLQLDALAAALIERETLDEADA